MPLIFKFNRYFIKRFDNFIPCLICISSNSLIFPLLRYLFFVIILSLLLFLSFPHSYPLSVALCFDCIIYLFISSSIFPPFYFPQLLSSILHPPFLYLLLWGLRMLKTSLDPGCFVPLVWVHVKLYTYYYVLYIRMYVLTQICYPADGSIFLKKTTVL